MHDAWLPKDGGFKLVVAGFGGEIRGESVQIVNLEIFDGVRLGLELLEDEAELLVDQDHLRFVNFPFFAVDEVQGRRWRVLR